MFDNLNIDDPIAFTIPLGDGFPIYWYGIIITVGIAVGAWWAGREIERRRQNVDELFNGLILVIVAGYIFARLTYVILDLLDGNAARYTSLMDIINIRAGGVNILGGFIGAALVGVFYIRWRRLKVWHYADVAGSTILIAQAIGRWGNFINQELYGPPTGTSWGILIDAPFRIAPYNDLVTYPPETRFHPTFFYESMALLLGFVLLVVLNGRYRDKWRPGTLFGLFMIWWGGNRAWIELFRPDQPTIGDSSITYSMLVAVGIVVAGVWVLLSRYDRLPAALGGQSRRKRRQLKPKPRRRQTDGS